MDLQQSPLYLKYIQLLNWDVITVDGIHIFIKHLPLMGGLAKIQRCEKLPALDSLIPALRSNKIRTVAIEPAVTIHQDEFTDYLSQLKKYFKINSSPFLPTKTIIIDLKENNDDMFKRFSEAKRRAVRRAQKNNIIIKESSDIADLIRIKNKSAGLFGFITTYGLKELWQIFGPKNATTLLAYSSKNKLIGGILMIFSEKTAYYWIAGATHQGKKLFAPTLLVWEALKLSKVRRCSQFDFVGVWDERMPKQYLDWKGFTKFKEGFGGSALYYPLGAII